jgi:hypothetical protein
MRPGIGGVNILTPCHADQRRRGSVYRRPEICGPEELQAVHANKHKQRTAAMWRGSPGLLSIEET